ncbi:MAG: hypothetical protein J0M12_13300 [Deltaproteobacteria bacterium]|nr:hypothetical protein [Deltaproteobacteria bacterium]
MNSSGRSQLILGLVAVIGIFSTAATAQIVVTTKPAQYAIQWPCYLAIDESSDVYACESCPKGQAPAYVFPNGLEFDSQYHFVCLDNLGTYNSETGAKTASNFDSALRGYVLNGKYLRTNLQTETPLLNRFVSNRNDFRLNIAGTSAANARQNVLWGSEVNLYYYINNYRKLFLNNTFIGSLGLSPTATLNVQNRQFRPDLQGIVNSRLPWFIPNELTAFTPASVSPPQNNFVEPSKRRAATTDALDTLSLDPGFVVGQYSAVLSNWLTVGNAQWPNDPTWGSVGNVSWRTDIRPALLEGIKLWNAYRYTSRTEPYQYAKRVMRRWNSYSCGGINQAPCNKGHKIDNVMMYLDSADPLLNNPTNPSWPASNSDDTLLFPYGTNYPTTGVRSGAGTGHFGPTNGALGGMFIGALFYDISKEVGLGDYKTDQLFWKTISLLDPAQAIDMTTFGQRVQQAARALFPNTGNPSISWYEQDIVDVFASRGVKMNNVTNFLDNVPAALGTATNPGPGTLTNVNSVGFGSSIPESQRNSSTGYNFLSFFINGYNVSTPGTQYVTYQFYKFSKYGPCDALELTNGTINTLSSTNPILNYDGSMAAKYQGRSLGNTLVMSPGSTMNFLRRRQSCVSEEEGYYAEDVRPFGFRVLKAIPNGFTFATTRVGTVGGRYSYRLSIVDPSLALSGPNTGPATYNWVFTEYNGAVVNASGQEVIYNALPNQPFTISVTRVRGAQNDNITLRERGNDLDRNSGKQFNQDFWNPGYPVGFDTIVDRRLVEGHGSYNSALNPVGGAFGVQGRRWTTPNQLVKPLRFSTVSHGLGSGSNQNGPYHFDQAVYYNACIWSTREHVTNFPGCHSDSPNGDYEIQVPFSQVGINLNDPFATVTASLLPGYLWTVNYPADWRLLPNQEYHFAGHISASVVSNGYSYNVCSYAQAAWDGLVAGNAADRSDWLAGANWSGQSGAPAPQTMRQYLSSSGSVSNCTLSAYKFEGQTVTQ